MCIAQTPHPLDTARSSISGSAKAVISFIASAPAIRASSATRVQKYRSKRARAKFGKARYNRHYPVEFFLALMRRAPGRVL